MAISKFDLSSIFKIEGEEKSVGSKDGSLLKKKKKKKKERKMYRTCKIQSILCNNNDLSHTRYFIVTLYSKMFVETFSYLVTTKSPSIYS